MLKEKKIGIVGGGIAGNAIAQFLSKKGFQITILEKVKKPLPIGSGIMLQKPALAILDKLGLRESIENNGCKINGFLGINKKGKTVLDFNFKSVNKYLYGVGVHRGSIHSNLVQKTTEDTNIDVRYGCVVISVEQNEDITIVKTEEGKTLTFDLLIVANGSGSLLRKSFPEIVSRSKVQNYSALWTTLPYDGAEFANKISHVYHKSRYMYGLMPIGFNNNEHEGASQINFFCAITKEYLDGWGKDKFEEWKKLSYKIAPQYKQFIDQITDYKQLVATPYFDAKLNPFYKGRVVFIGDACHALSPHLSAGTNLALMDAYELSKAMFESTSYDVAFEKYYTSRKQQIRFYYKISKLITPIFQSEVNLSWFRDSLIPLLYKIPLTKKIMVETISGIKKSIFRNVDKDFYEY